MLKKVVAVFIVVALATAGYLGYAHWDRARFAESLAPHVKNASLRVTNALALDAARGITYKEVFERLEADVSEIDKRILEVQTLTSPRYEQATTPVLEYMRASQGFLRAALNNYRKVMAFSSSVDWVSRSLDDLRDASSYGFQYARQRVEKARRDSDIAEAEAEKAQGEVYTAAASLLRAREGAAKIVTSDALVDVDKLRALAQKTPPKPRSAATNEIDTSNSALQTAILRGDDEEVRSLLRQGAINVNHQNATGNTALHLAVQAESTAWVRLLLDYGAATDIANAKGETPGSMAAGKSIATYLKK